MAKRKEVVGSIPYVTIEKITNGFIVIFPFTGEKVYYSTVNGLVSLFEKMWDAKLISKENSVITKEKIEDITEGKDEQ